MNDIQKRKRRPETFTAYRVEDPKPRKSYDWDFFPLHLVLGMNVLLWISAPIILVLVLVAMFGWYAPLVIGGVILLGWLAWRLGRLMLGEW